MNAAGGSCNFHLVAHVVGCRSGASVVGLCQMVDLGEGQMVAWLSESVSQELC